MSSVSQSVRHRIPGLTAGLALLLGMSLQVSCGSDPIGTLTVPFQISFGNTCADYEVDLVEVTIEPTGDDAEDNITVTETATCEAGEVVFTDVGIGMYKVSAKAMYADGVVGLDTVTAGSKTAEVLEGSETSSERLELGPVPALLRVYWALNKGGKQAMCGDVFVDNFVVNVFPQPMSAPMFDHEYTCTDKPDDDLYHTAPDAGRDLDGGLASFAVIEYRNAENTPLGGQLEACFTPPGHGRSIEIDIACNDDICEITSGNACP